MPLHLRAGIPGHLLQILTHQPAVLAAEILVTNMPECSADPLLFFGTFNTDHLHPVYCVIQVIPDGINLPVWRENGRHECVWVLGVRFLCMSLGSYAQ